MKEVTSSEFKTRFGEFLNVALREPLHITKSGKPSVVVLSSEEYEHLQSLEDAYLGIQAEQALARNQFVTGEEAMALLRDRLDGGA